MRLEGLEAKVEVHLPLIVFVTRISKVLAHCEDELHTNNERRFADEQIVVAII